mgnify:CR=1 FL=1
MDKSSLFFGYDLCLLIICTYAWKVPRTFDFILIIKILKTFFFFFKDTIFTGKWVKMISASRLHTKEYIRLGSYSVPFMVCMEAKSSRLYTALET